MTSFNKITPKLNEMSPEDRANITKNLPVKDLASLSQVSQKNYKEIQPEINKRKAKLEKEEEKASRFFFFE